MLRLATLPLLRHRRARLLLALLLGSAVGYAQWGSWNEASLDGFSWQLHLVPLAVALVIQCARAVASVLCWLVVVRKLGGAVTTGEAFRVYLVSDLGKYLPGHVMHAVGRVALLHQRGLSPAVTSASIAVDLMLSLVAAAIVGLIGIAAFPGVAGVGGPVPLAAWIAVGVTLAVLVGANPRMMRWAIAAGSRFLPGRPAAPDLVVLNYRSILVLLLARCGLWLVAGSALFAAIQAVYPLNAEALPSVWGLVAISYLGGLAVPLTPSGIGPREGLMTVLASTMMPLPVAALASVLFRAVSILAEVLAAVVVLAWVGSTDRAAPASADASLHTCSALASTQGGAVGTPSCACGRAS